MDQQQVPGSMKSSMAAARSHRRSPSSTASSTTRLPVNARASLPPTSNSVPSGKKYHFSQNKLLVVVAILGLSIICLGTDLSVAQVYVHDARKDDPFHLPPYATSSSIANDSSDVSGVGPDFDHSKYYPPGSWDELKAYQSHARRKKSHRLPIYYINLDRSTDRRALMEDMFRRLGIPSEDVTRVSAHNVTKVQQMMREGFFRLQNKVTLVDSSTLTSDGEGDEQQVLWQRRGNHQYDLKEGACLLSHLDAVRQAYQAGHEYALVLEDDALLSPKFIEHWHTYAQMAPDNWKILQWANDFELIIDQGRDALIHDPWTIWMPQHYSARANIYSRRGMEELLGRIHSTTNTATSNQLQDIWTLDEVPTLVADELVYYYCRDVYTSTKPWVGRLAVTTTLQEKGEELMVGGLAVSPQVPQLQLAQRPESLLVISQYRWQSTEECKRESDWLRLDAESVCSLHRRHSCDWKVQILVTDPNLLDNAQCQAAVASLPSYIELQISLLRSPTETLTEAAPPVNSLNGAARTTTTTTNKFAFIMECTDLMVQYDLVMLKDYDARTIGLPWDTFVDRKGSAVMAAPLRQVPNEGMYQGIHQPYRSNVDGTSSSTKSQSKAEGGNGGGGSFPFHDALQWQFLWYTKWSGELFEHVTPTRTPYLESYMVLMDGSFASWFFGQVFPAPSATGAIRTYLKQSMEEGGPELMWCGAAQKWSRRARPACHLIPVVARYEDAKPWCDHLESKEEDCQSFSWPTLPIDHVMGLFHSANEQFARWMDEARYWKDLMQGQPLLQIEYICEDSAFVEKDPFSIQKCIDIICASAHDDAGMLFLERRQSSTGVRSLFYSVFWIFTFMVATISGIVSILVLCIWSMQSLRAIQSPSPAKP